MSTADPADERPTSTQPDDQLPPTRAQPDQESQPDEEAETGARPEDGTGGRRVGPVWLTLGIVVAAVLVCCCSAVVGLALSWTAGLFGRPPT